ncbi:MAG: hypothetical protein HY297_05215 [Thaumarchaeota archaeon]|nr:hypothetical protein [Nitrososphaerota archaeon]
MSVRVNSVSRTAAILIMAIGAFMLLGGLATNTVANTVAGVAFAALGVALYVLLSKFSGKGQREIREAGKD